MRLELCGPNDVAEWLADSQLVQSLKHLDWRDDAIFEEEAWETLAGAIDGSSLLSFRLTVPEFLQRPYLL